MVSIVRLILGCLVIVAASADAFAQRPPTEQQRACTRKLFPNYDPSNLKMCVRVCAECYGGTNCTNYCQRVYNAK